VLHRASRSVELVHNSGAVPSTFGGVGGSLRRLSSGKTVVVDVPCARHRVSLGTGIRIPLGTKSLMWLGFRVRLVKIGG
jgi:hypothetical protein